MVDMIKVKVYPGPFCDDDALDEEGFLYLKEGTTLDEVYKKMKYPFVLRRLGLSMVNHERVKIDTVLKDGDTVSFFTPLSGG